MDLNYNIGMLSSQSNNNYNKLVSSYRQDLTKLISDYGKVVQVKSPIINFTNYQFTKISTQVTLNIIGDDVNLSIREDVGTVVAPMVVADAIFSKGDVIQFLDVSGYVETGLEEGFEDFQAIVIDSEPQNTYLIAPINGAYLNSISGKGFPDIMQGTNVVKLGSTSIKESFENVESVEISNFCQTFNYKYEIPTDSQITMAKFKLKAINQSKILTEGSLLYGVGRRVQIDNNEIHLTQGLFNQTTHQVSIQMSAPMSPDKILDLCVESFSKGSGHKILFAGYELIRKFDSLIADYTTANKGILDIKNNKIITNYGTLSLVYTLIFDISQHESNGIIVDPNYLTKFVYKPFSIKVDKDKIYTTESSCLVCTDPDTSLKITMR